MDIRVEDQNLLDYSTWMAGTSGSTTGFNQISTSVINYRELNTDPFGNTNVIWNSVTTASGTSPRAGYTTGFIDVDITKTYRSSVWIKKTNNSIYQTITHGIRCYNNLNQIQNVIDITSDTTGTDTFYMTAPKSTDITQDEWELHVGFIYPTSWTGTTDSQYTGIYKPDGTKLSIGSSVLAHGDLKFSGTTTKIYHIVLNIRNGGSSEPSGLTSQICYPRIDLVDGTEPSINTLLTNEGMWRSGTTYIKVEDNNLLDYSTWIEGASGSTAGLEIATGFRTTTNYGSICIENQLDPFNNLTNVYKSTTTSTLSASYAGFYIDYMNVDATKTYRASCWMKQTHDFTNNNTYLGIRTFNDALTQTQTIDISSGSAGTNRYPVRTTTAVPKDEWRLYSAYIYPTTWSGTTDSSFTGLFKPDGTNLGIGAGAGDLKFSGNTTKLYMVVYGTYNNTAGGESGLTSVVCYPRIDLCDGTEPSIATLLNNEGGWRSGTTMIYVDDVWKNT